MAPHSFQGGDEYRKYGAFSSSVDPNKLAASVSGALKVVASAAVLVGMASTGVDLNQIGDNVVQIGQQATTIIAAGTVAWGLCESTYGLARKVLVAAINRSGPSN